MDLSTTYLGSTLAHPFMAGASPLADHLDTARRLEDGGASALSIDTDLRNPVLELTRALRIPVALKLSPYFTALGNVARRLRARSSVPPTSARSSRGRSSHARARATPAA